MVVLKDEHNVYHYPIVFGRYVAFTWCPFCLEKQRSLGVESCASLRLPQESDSARIV